MFEEANFDRKISCLLKKIDHLESRIEELEKSRQEQLKINQIILNILRSENESRVHSN